MKKKVLALLLAAATTLSLAACGSSGNNSGGGSADTAKSDTTTEAAADTTSAAPAASSASSEASSDSGNKAASGKTMLFYTPFIGDFGIADMGWRAVQAAKEKYGYDVTLVEYGQDNSQAVNSLVDALDTKHYDYVVANGWYITDTVVEKSKNGEWSDINFILYDTAPSDDFSGTNNIYGVSFAQSEGSFLAGVYSSIMSKSGKVGAVINLDAPITNDFGTGWLCGVKYARKELGLDVTPMYSYMGEVTVQNDYESVNVAMDNGCDYVYNVGASVSLGAMQAADEKGGYEDGKFIIGTDYDQYEYFEQQGDVVGYKSMVTSMLKNIENCTALLLENINGEKTGIEPGNHVYGVKEGGVGLAENDWYKENTPQDVQDQIHDLSDKIANGDIKVVSYFDFPSYDDFANYRDNVDAEFTN